MASMSTEIAVLRALLHLSRRRAPATLADIVARVREDQADVQRALASLARAQLVQRTGDSARLSLGGLAVAVAAAARAKADARRPKTLTSGEHTARSARVVPMARRRRAAA
jgi:DNA-binding IclR family transcriptional regulator